MKNLSDADSFTYTKNHHRLINYVVEMIKCVELSQKDIHVIDEISGLAPGRARTPLVPPKLFLTVKIKKIMIDFKILSVFFPKKNMCPPKKSSYVNGRDSVISGFLYLILCGNKTTIHVFSNNSFFYK